MVTALLAFGASPAAVLFAIAACLAFAAHEPMLIVLGHRGARALTRDGASARRWLAILVAASVFAAGLAVLIAPAARGGVAVVAVPVALVIVLAWKRAVHTLAGEIVAATALAGASVPVAMASGAQWRDASLMWAAWAIGYAYTIVAVHRIIERNRKSWSSSDLVVAACALLGVAVLAVTGYEHARVALPLALAATVTIAAKPSARRLRTIGIVLVGASLIAVGLAQTIRFG